VHVDHDVEPSLLWPFDDAIEQTEALSVAALEIHVVNRDTNRIEASTLEELDIVARDVTVEVLTPELVGSFRSEKLVGQRFDLARWLRTSFEMKDVAFADEPIAKVGATEAKRMTLGVDEVSVLGADEVVLCGRGSG
jgi:hypothetical protein